MRHSLKNLSLSLILVLLASVPAVRVVAEEHPLAGSLPEHVIFRTAQTVSTGLGGLGVMDARCQAKAEAAGLAGTWMALLSDSVQDARDRLAAAGADGPFFNSCAYCALGPQLIALDLIDLFDGHILAAVCFNELGQDSATDSSTWTATLTDGTYAGSSYGDWTSFSGSARVGRQRSVDRQWLDWFEQAGVHSANLYCVRTDIDPPLVPSPDPPMEHRVFVSSAQYDGDLGGLAGAHQECQRLAGAAGMGDRVWKAILSDSSNDARDSLRIVGPVLDMHDNFVAEDFDDLFDGGNAGFVRYDETGALRNHQLVWTGSHPDGSRYSGAGATAYKQDWRSRYGYAMAGMTTDMEAGWLERQRSSYDGSVFPARLYCIDGQTAEWLKMDPPPDVDKAAHGHTGTDTCWQATAANMLAGAGYGDGTTVQDRADDIYGDLTAHFGTGGGWTDSAIKWWLSSSHNTWASTNPYTVVKVRGYKDPKYPWAALDGAKKIGNWLRKCSLMGLSISWPTSDSSVGADGHAITAWGDIGGSSTLVDNPSEVLVTDSDRDGGGDVQSYAYDEYTNPNPGGPNEGNGWYIDFNTNHPYIKHVIELRAADTASSGASTRTIVLSASVWQSQAESATGLRYTVGADTEILSYRTEIDWSTASSPAILEGQPRDDISVVWDLADHPVPQDTWLTITSELVLGDGNSIAYEDVTFVHPSGDVALPVLVSTLETPDHGLATNTPNISGGYVVGSLDLYRDPSGPEKVASYRFQHEYDLRQDPEHHTLTLVLHQAEGFYVEGLKAGHTYGFLDDGSLWDFADWMTVSQLGRVLVEPGDVLSLALDWDGLLPYPPGEDFPGDVIIQ